MPERHGVTGASAGIGLATASLLAKKRLSDLRHQQEPRAEGRSRARGDVEARCNLG